MEHEVNCPCCNNKIKIQIGDDGEISVISLIDEIELNELQIILNTNGIEFGSKT